MTDPFIPQRRLAPPSRFARFRSAAARGLSYARQKTWRGVSYVGKKTWKGILWLWKRTKESYSKKRRGSGPSAALLPWLLVTGGIALFSLVVFFQHSVSNTPSGLWQAILYWVKGLWWVWLTLAILVLALFLLRRGTDKPKRPKDDERKRPTTAPREDPKVVTKQVVTGKSEVVHKIPLLVPFLVVAGLIWLGSVVTKEMREPRFVRPSTAPSSVMASVRTVSVPERIVTGCKHVGEVERVSAPISSDNSTWSRFVDIPALCTPVPSIPHESKRYRYRCMDKDGMGPFEEESGKCAGGVTALSFQKRSPLTNEGEEMPADQYWADLPLEITFKD